MKRPAAASRKKVSVVVRKKPAGKKAGKKAARAVRRKPAASLKPIGELKPIAELTRKDCAFFETSKRAWQGIKSSRQGYIFEHVSFNKFSQTATKVPLHAKKTRVPRADWIGAFFFNPKRYLIVPDAAKMPERATGKAYRIEDNGGRYAVCLLCP